MHKQLKLFLIMLSFFTLASGMLGPIYAIYVKDIGGDILAAGTAWSIFTIVSGLGIILTGKIEDKLKKDKLFIIIGQALISLGFLAYFFISTVIQLFLVQVLLGIGTMIVIPARDSFYTYYLERGKFASQWAAWEGIWFIVTGIAALMGAYLAKIFGFKVLFLAMFFASLIGILISIQLREKK